MTLHRREALLQGSAESFGCFVGDEQGGLPFGALADEFERSMMRHTLRTTLLSVAIAGMVFLSGCKAIPGCETEELVVVGPKEVERVFRGAGRCQVVLYPSECEVGQLLGSCPRAQVDEAACWATEREVVEIERAAFEVIAQMECVPRRRRFHDLLIAHLRSVVPFKDDWVPLMVGKKDDPSRRVVFVRRSDVVVCAEGPLSRCTTAP